MTAWTSVITQTTGGWSSVAVATVPSSILTGAGEPIGLLLALTYTETASIVGAPWTSVITQVSGGWTSVITQVTN